MSILVVGSIAIDSVETPYGKEPNAYGGSALFFSAAASPFAPVSVVGVVGNDFDFAEIDFLKSRNVNFDGVKVEDGKTFRWGGKYHKNMNHRDTLFTDLNVFETFSPQIPDAYRSSEFLFLANIHPQLQLDVLAQVDKPRLTVLDTMNFWISGAKSLLMEVVRQVNVLIINDQESFELTGIPNIFESARALMQEGPEVIIIKKGEHGSVLLTKDDVFLAQAYPVATVTDPTGAGDSFAGGFVGYLAAKNSLDKKTLREAVVNGGIVASFTVEDFSFRRLAQITEKDVHARTKKLKHMVTF